LHGGHCPQDSTNKKRDIIRATSTMQAVSSKTMNPAAPKPLPAASNAACSSGTSSDASVSTPLDTPEKTALTRRPERGPPPTSSTTDRSDAPSSTSPTAGRTTSPTTVATTVPGESLVPSERNQSAPRARMCGTLHSVSTLLTTVGLAPPVLRADDATPPSHPVWTSLANRPCS
jgi:hypothetical protein